MRMKWTEDDFSIREVCELSSLNNYQGVVTFLPSFKIPQMPLQVATKNDNPDAIWL